MTGADSWPTSGEYWERPLQRALECVELDVYAEDIQEAASKIYGPAAERDLNTALLLLFVGQECEGETDEVLEELRPAIASALEEMPEESREALSIAATAFYREAGAPSLSIVDLESMEDDGPEGNARAICALKPYSSFFDFSSYRLAVVCLGGAAGLEETSIATYCQAARDPSITQAFEYSETQSGKDSFGDALMLTKSLVEVVDYEGQELTFIKRYKSMGERERGLFWRFANVARIVLAYYARKYQEDLINLFEAIEDELSDEMEAGNLTYKGVTAMQAYKYGLDEDEQPTDTPLGELVQRAMDRAREGREATEAAGAAITIPENTPIFLDRPIKSFFAIDAFSQSLYRDKLINAGEKKKITVISKDKRRSEVNIFVSIEDGEDGVKKERAFTNEEENTKNAIFSIVRHDQKLGRVPTLSVDRVYSHMAGEGKRPTANKRKEIEDIIVALGRMPVTMDATEEFRKRQYIGPDDTMVREESFLLLSGIRGTKKGEPVRAWAVVKTPLVMERALKLGQFVEEPAYLLDVHKVSEKTGKVLPQAVTMGTNQIAMATYLLKRVAIIKRDRKQAADAYRKNEARRKKAGDSIEKRELTSFYTKSDKILFDSLFAETETETDNRTQQKRNRDFCFDVLAYWTAEKYIGGYEVIKQGKTIAGVRILLKSPREPKRALKQAYKAGELAEGGT